MTGSTIPDELLRSLRSAKRNRYFYGKPLDAAAFQLEQCYGIEQRWLLNRLTLGPGVLCGLEVLAGQDGTVAVQPGVAVDGLGREIIVPAPFVIDPFQPLDGYGKPDGDRLAAGAQVTIWLSYNECATDQTSVAISDCDGGTTNQAGATLERYLPRVTVGLPDARPPSLTPEQRDAIYPPVPAADFDRRIATEGTLAITSAPPDAASVVVATVTLGAAGTPSTVDQYGYRPEVFSNTVLFELIAALAERVDACCNAVHTPVTRTLQVVSGDAQSGPSGQTLANPVAFLVVDENGTAVDGEAVELKVSADATLVDADLAAPPAGAADLTVTSHDGGAVRVNWQLGAAAGQQTLVARVLSTGSSQVVGATGTAAPPPPEPPRVTDLRPGNAVTVPDAWATQPTITLAFDQALSQASLDNPEAWLGLWWFQNFNGNFTSLRRIKLGLADAGGGTAPTFRGDQVNAERFTVLVVMLGSAPEVVADATGSALDAEFAGTKLTADQLGALWGNEEFQPDQAFVDAITDGGGLLPSGDGQPGGKFFSSFFRLGPVN